MNIKDFFKDKHGDVVLYQPPNLILIAWLLLQVADILFFHGKYMPVQILATATLFAWAYEELRSGVSPFRKTLGGAVLLLIIVTTFMR